MTGAVSIVIVAGMVGVVSVPVMVAVVAITVITASSMIAVALRERGHSDVEGGSQDGECDSFFHTTGPLKVKGV